MNTKEIEQALKEHALTLKKGSETQKAFGQQIHALALAIEKDRKDSERPITAETVKQIHVGTPKFQPRRLRPEDMRMGGKKPY
jgi:hypothetical protein